MARDAVDESIMGSGLLELRHVLYDQLLRERMARCQYTFPNWPTSARDPLRLHRRVDVPLESRCVIDAY